MAFQVRDLNTILTDMISQIIALNTGITDFTEGSVIRSIIETFALQIQRLETNVFEGIIEGIAVGTFQNFNFQRLPATFPSGLVRFYATSPQSSPQVIVAGTQTQVTNTNIIYSVAQNTVLPANANYIDVLCYCTTLGSAGNTPANTVTTIISPASFIASVSNPSPIINGQDQESDQSRQTRFQNYLLSLSRGTTLAIESAAANVFITDSNGNVIERVIQALVFEPFLNDVTKPVGQIQVFIDNGSGTASYNLLVQVQNTLIGYVDTNGFRHDGYISAGVEATIASVIPFSVPVICTITVSNGADPVATANNVQTAISGYIQTLTIGESVLFAKIVNAAISTSGVDNVSFGSPTFDVVVPIGNKAVPGTITILTQ